MGHRRFAIHLAWGLLALSLLWLLTDSAPPTVAAPVCRPLFAPGETFTVCLSGACDFATIQDAVDAAEAGDVIKVAAGNYIGVSARPRDDIASTGTVTQVVYISKTVTIQGGYTTDFTEPPDPIAAPTILDAQGEGRVLYITGEISPTIEGVHITGGDASGLGGGEYGRDAGGGLYLYFGNATISGNTVISNTAEEGYGGGLYLYYGGATLSGSSVISNSASRGGGLYLRSDHATLDGNSVACNTAHSTGGGLYLRFSGATLSGNFVLSNTASYDGGGLYLHSSDATISGNTLISNTAEKGYGGGLYLYYRGTTLSGNTIISNTASGGGGLSLNNSDATLAGNVIASNGARYTGGGLRLYGSDATLTNNIVVDNRAEIAGSGLFIERSSPRLLHTTMAHNSGGDGSGVHVFSWSGHCSTPAFTNTILVGHGIGITVTKGNTATLEGTLWGDGAWANGADWGGAGTMVTGTVNLWGDPDFAAPDTGDYHIGPASAAINVGLDAGVITDIDGDVRPQWGGYDLGADECTAEPTPTPTPLPTVPPPTMTPTETSTPMPTSTPTNTPAPTDTPTPTNAPTDTPTQTLSPTATSTRTPAPTDTPIAGTQPSLTPTSGAGSCQIVLPLVLCRR